MVKRVLVTGAAGFVGRHLLQELGAEGFDVTGLGYEGRPDWLSPETSWLEVNLLDVDDLERLGRDWWGVIHLAAISVPSELDSPMAAMRNVAMTVGLLEHLDSARFLYVSSALVYAPSRSPHAETSVIRPNGLYGLSKHLCEEAVFNYDNKLDVRIARPFNHLGVGMPPNLAIPSMVRRALDSDNDERPLEMFGQDSQRDFVDVQDVVRAYIEILRLDEPEHRVFNVCTGNPVYLSDVARIVLGILGRSSDVVFQGRAISSDETSALVGNCDRLMQATGWQPRVEIQESLEAMITAMRAGDK